MIMELADGLHFNPEATFLLDPSKPDLFDATRIELSQPGWSFTPSPHPLLLPSLKANRNGMWLARIIGPYQARLLSDFGTSKGPNRLIPAFVAVARKFRQPGSGLARCERVKKLFSEMGVGIDSLKLEGFSEALVQVEAIFNEFISNCTKDAKKSVLFHACSLNYFVNDQWLSRRDHRKSATLESSPPVLGNGMLE
ncbi:hypothetical protein AVEN_177070-1 [Araneus ventricosus]|uniref:Uncharacterized protein n=1 Tax=Araneus ventricosus TaxID=182803 RepID=A0A4Y2CTB2_ARAVE|nr:hypothetical protein AVEN_177070-1 [Araneus ventricosus]